MFVKVHGSILRSSIWLETAQTRIVWLTMLVLADENGVVEASVGGLAHLARVTREECEAALAIFTSPDPDSRDGTSGERVEKVPGGWLVLNHANYRDRRTDAQVAAAARVARHRASRVTCNAVTPGNGTSPSEAEAEAEPTTPPTPSKGEGSRVMSIVGPPRRIGGAKRKPRTDLPEGLAAHVLLELVSACKSLDGPAAGPRHSADHPPFLDALRKLHAAHAPTADEWTAVIRERLALSREGQTFGSLTIASLCVPGNFERWLAGARARARGGGSQGRGAAPPSPRPVASVDLTTVSSFLLDAEREGGDT